MKKIFPHFWSYMLVFILFSCQTPDTDSIDLSRPAGTIIQKLSDMADNLRAIPLETNDSCLLSDYIKIWVGNKYIVTADKNAMHLFGKDGKHIRQLASQGKGPGEFSSIATFTVNESNERLYYRDWNQRTSLGVIHLKTGENTEKIQGIPNDISSLLLTGNHTLLCSTSSGIGKTAGKKYDLVIISENGQKLSHIVADTINIDKAKNIFNDYLSKIGDRISYWSPNTDHILFQIEDSLKMPLLVFQIKDPFNYKKRRGNFLRIKAETAEELMIQMQEYEIFTEEEGMFGVRSVPNSKTFDYRINKNNRSVYLIDHFYDDLLGEKYPSFPQITVTNGNHIFIQKNTQQIKQLTEEQLKAGKELTPALKALNARLNEDDNPVIITGTLKKPI